MRRGKADQIDIWYSRLRRVIRIAGLGLDLAECTFIALGAALIGMVAGVALAGRLGGGGSVWMAAGMGALLGLYAGIRVARRVYFGGPKSRAAARRLQDPGHNDAEPYRFPGVKEAFARARRREVGLSLLLVPILLALFYVVESEEMDWPAALLPFAWLVAILVALTVLVFLLLFLNARCPHCRQRLVGMIELRRCAACGVVLRD